MTTSARSHEIHENEGQLEHTIDSGHDGSKEETSRS